MPWPNVLVIAVDGLRASALGAYGNTTYDTPTLDRFATQSVLCDAYFADSTELSPLYGGFWQATSALRTPSQKPNWSLPALLAEVGFETRLITDCRQIVEFPAVQDFAEAVVVDGGTVAEAIEIEQMSAAGVISEVLEHNDSLGESTGRPMFLWAHLRGAYGPWDAPHELAMTLIEEGDAAPERSVVPPDRIVERSVHADEIYAENCRYAAQVLALDSLLAPLFDLLDSEAAGECICVLMGTRGFPLGEHGQLGGIDGRLYSEQLHIPLLMRLPEGRNALSRVSHLIHPADLPMTILRLLEIEAAAGDGEDFLRSVNQSVSPVRTQVLASGANRALSIRTPSWYLRIASPQEKELAELFVKPDDRWEMNDVASLCSEITEELTAFALSERSRIEAGDAFATEPLPAHLLEATH